MSYNSKSPSVVVAPVFVNGVSLVREFARKGAHVVAVDSDAAAPGLRTRFARERAIVPSPADAAGTFSEWLMSRRDLYGAIVVPTDDYHVRELHGNYDALSAHYRLAVSPGESTRIALGKDLTAAVAREAGIPTPATVPLVGPDDIERAVREVRFPAIIKPVFSIAFKGAFGVKSMPVENRRELQEKLALTSRAGHRVMLQEVIPGEDVQVVSCKVYATDSGEVLGALVGAKLAIYPPGFGVSQMQVARRIPAVEQGTRRLLEYIGFRGSLASVEWKFDRRESTWKMLEINPRSVMAVSLMKFAGVDIVDMLWRDKLGLPRAPQCRIHYGRKWAYLKNGLLLYRRHPELRLSWRQYLRLYSPPITFALLDPRDLKPFLCDIAPVIGRRFK